MWRLQSIAFATCLIGLGCHSTPKKPPAPNSTTGRDDRSPFWADDKSPRGGSPVPPTSPIDGMLAGMLIDDSGRPQPNAVVNVTPADAATGTKPVGIQADGQGYFTIKGLKAGATYFLSVRSEEGGHVLGGSAMTQATNTRMLIRLSEGNVSSVTPPPQVSPNETGPFAPDKKDGKTKLDPPASSVPGPEPVPKDPLLEANDPSWGPGKTPPTSRPIAPPPPVSPGNPNIADTTPLWPPTATIPGSTPKIESPPPPSAPSMSAVPSNSSPVPTSPLAMVDRRANFTVYDLTGSAVEFRNLTDRRFIVLDFWTTTCPPCLKKIPDLIAIQGNYSGYVEVVGVACDDQPFAQRIKSVEGIKNYYLRQAQRPINYSIYLEGENQEGRLQQQFKVRAYPTMVLLDHSGRELWRGSETRQLEDAIKYYVRRK